MVLPADTQQLATLKDILHTFATSTGLKVNFAKSFIVPINVDESRWDELTSTLGCQLGTVPFTYLSLPFGYH